jgi:hypothetical protein
MVYSAYLKVSIGRKPCGDEVRKNEESVIRDSADACLPPHPASDILENLRAPVRSGATTYELACC